MRQRTRLLVSLVVEYDDDLLTEHEAQQVYLQGSETRVSCRDWGVSGTVQLDHVQIVADMVDRDCVPTQARADQVEIPKR